MGRFWLARSVDGRACVYSSAGRTGPPWSKFLHPEHPVPGLRESDFADNPFTQFRSWLDRALAAPLPQPLGMALATVGADGRPSVRMVLLRGFDERGFVFFTNYDSRKAQEL